MGSEAFFQQDSVVRDLATSTDIEWSWATDERPPGRESTVVDIVEWSGVGWEWKGIGGGGGGVIVL